MCQLRFVTPSLLVIALLVAGCSVSPDAHADRTQPSTSAGQEPARTETSSPSPSPDGLSVETATFDLAWIYADHGVGGVHAMTRVRPMADPVRTLLMLADSEIATRSNWQVNLDLDTHELRIVGPPAVVFALRTAIAFLRAEQSLRESLIRALELGLLVEVEDYFAWRYLDLGPREPRSEPNRRSGSGPIQIGGTRRATLLADLELDLASIADQSPALTDLLHEVEAELRSR